MYLHPFLLSTLYAVVRDSALESASELRTHRHVFTEEDVFVAGNTNNQKCVDAVGLSYEIHAAISTRRYYKKPDSGYKGWTSTQGREASMARMNS